MNPRISRRDALLVASAAGLGLARPAAAQPAWPTKPVRFVVPFPAGGSTDVVGRLFAEHLRQGLGQSFVIDNRAGAGGMIGTDVAAKATADGYTLLSASSGPVSINPLLQKAAYGPKNPVDFTINQPIEIKRFPISNYFFLRKRYNNFVGHLFHFSIRPFHLPGTRPAITDL